LKKYVFCETRKDFAANFKSAAPSSQAPTTCERAGSHNCNGIVDIATAATRDPAPDCPGSALGLSKPSAIF
jgi:hypothetical protein